MAAARSLLHDGGMGFCAVVVENAGFWFEFYVIESGWVVGPVNAESLYVHVIIRKL